ncbi:MAG: MotA/TolQ/ExbB proton channel family protein [Akkermansiaceae bacterium]
MKLLRLPLFIVPIFLFAILVQAQNTESPPTDNTTPEDNTTDVTTDDSSFIEDPLGSELVQVDWFEEMKEGGVTMIVLGILSVALVAFLLERFLTLRAKRFVPPALIAKVKPLFQQEKFDEIRKACDAHPSPAADIIRHCVDYRETDFDLLQTTTSDIGARVVIDQEEKCQPLSVIAGVAPLLGLLGTMIGMIESFKLVEVFGDEGGASLLAGSISKALITTAVGLILAIPSVLGYHWARRRVHHIATALEVESETLLKSWFLSKKSSS